MLGAIATMLVLSVSNPSAGGAAAIDSLAASEIVELRGLEWGHIKDGGSLRFEAIRAVGDTLQLFVDNRMRRDVIPADMAPGLIYLGDGVDGVPLPGGSQAEQEVVIELRSWIRRNFVRDAEGTIVEVAPDATDPSPTVGEARTLEFGLGRR